MLIAFHKSHSSSYKRQYSTIDHMIALHLISCPSHCCSIDTIITIAIMIVMIDYYILIQCLIILVLSMQWSMIELWIQQEAKEGKSQRILWMDVGRLNSCGSNHCLIMKQGSNCYCCIYSIYWIKQGYQRMVCSLSKDGSVLWSLINSAIRCSVSKAVHNII